MCCIYLFIRSIWTHSWCGTLTHLPNGDFRRLYDSKADKVDLHIVQSFAIGFPWLGHLSRLTRVLSLACCNMKRPLAATMSDNVSTCKYNRQRLSNSISLRDNFRERKKSVRKMSPCHGNGGCQAEG
jgi:hypothetical protein